MTDLILHHYPMSPFAEKIRLVLGAKKLTWKSVIIPRVMPKPDVIALTGGYRKTPILQVGADIYCDTALIAKQLDGHAPSLYPARHAAAALAMSQWIDTFFFGVAVAQVFRPANLAHMFADNPADLDVFTKDRAAMRVNATTRRISALEADAVAHSFLSALERQFAAGAKFVVGDELSIADFSAYHCLWFMRRAPGSAKLIEPHKQVTAWLARMSDFGHGSATELPSSEAIAIAKRSTPSHVSDAQGAGDIRVGDDVQVLPTDYGIDPSPGKLVTCTADEIVIARTDPRAGNVHVHFPRMQYELRKAA